MDGQLTDRIEKKIMTAKRIVLSLHKDADLDSLGSNMGMYLYLRQVGKQAVILNGVDEGSRDYWNFLSGMDNLTHKNISDFDWQDGDVFLAIDIPAEVTIDSNKPPKFPIKGVTTIVVDHHYDSNTRYGEINLIEKRSSASEIVLDLIETWGGEVDKTMADFFYAGLLSDTGGFRFSNVNMFSFKSAAKIYDYGARCDYIAGKIATRSLSIVRAVSLVIAQGKILANGKVLFCLLTDERLSKIGLKMAGLGSVYKTVGFELSNIGDLIIGITAFTRDVNKWKVSLRANNPDDLRDVAIIAGELGGGGHKQAASCEIEATSEKELIDKVMKIVMRHYPDLG